MFELFATFPVKSTNVKEDKSTLRPPKETDFSLVLAETANDLNLINPVRTEAVSPRH